MGFPKVLPARLPVFRGHEKRRSLAFNRLHRNGGP